MFLDRQTPGMTREETPVIGIVLEMDKVRCELGEGVAPSASGSPGEHHNEHTEIGVVYGPYFEGAPHQEAPNVHRSAGPEFMHQETPNQKAAENEEQHNSCPPDID